MKPKITHVSKKKIESVKELSRLLKEKRTIMIASIKNIPASQFQEISKKLRGKAIIKVPKKSLIDRALDSSKEKNLEDLKGQIQDSVAIVFSDLGPFELALDLLENKSKARARPGQIAPEDIEIPAGSTDLPPGPAISELGNLGIQIQIEKGKISIKQPKVVAKAGEKISKGAAEVMGKLEIMPFKIGFVPLSAFDNKEKKIYLSIHINREEAVEELKSDFAKALTLAIEVSYSSEDTIMFLLGKAAAQEAKLTRVITGEPEPVATPAVTQEAPAEAKKEEKEESVSSTEGLAGLFG